MRATRRRWLAAAGAALAVPILPGCSVLPVIPSRPRPDAAQAIGWVEHESGRFTLTVPRAEIGQRIGTAMRRIAAVELGVPPDRIAVRMHRTDTVEPVRATVGSESLRDFAGPLAQACATLRAALEGTRWSPEATRPRGDADADAAIRALPPTDRTELLPLVRGEARFAADVRLEGMLHGRVLRADASPALASRLLRADRAAARAVPGCVALVEEAALALGAAPGVGVVARTPGALDRVAAALDATWQVDGTVDPAQVAALTDVDRDGPGREHAVHDDAVDASGPWDVDLRIDVPMAAHAAIEPRVAVARFDADSRLEVWTGTQDAFYVRAVLARAMGLPAARIVVHACRAGGAFGGRTLCNVELEAAVLARACGAPVKVQWTRAQEFALAFHRPPSSHRIRARVRDGRLEAWWHRFASSHVLFTSAVLPPWLQRATDLLGDDGIARGASLPYAATRRRATYRAARLPVWTGPWRGLGAGPNVFAIESAIDECAHVAGEDPLAFRLRHALDSRLAGVLRAAALDAGWTPDARHVSAGGRLASGRLTGRGIACGIYKAMSYAAVVADVEVDPDTGSVTVRTMWCAHDCGRVFDPDGVRAQCEGNLVWGLGMVLVEALPLRPDGVAARTFADAPIPRLGSLPVLHVAALDSDAPPTGAGETAIVAAGAAIANAVRAATGVRVTRLPIDPQALRSAMAAAQAPTGGRAPKR